MQSQAGDLFVRVHFFDITENGMNVAECLNAFSEQLKTEYGNAGLTTYVSYQSAHPLADHHGIGCPVVIEDSNGERVHQDLFAYQVQDYVVLINVTGLTQEAVSEVMNSFTAF
jgi:hypothetical protein